MPTYTLELWRVAEFTGGDIGLNEYPIFDPKYREELNKKIFEHFHDREIGTETIKRFQFYMRRRMNEIMPLYNQLYESQKLVFDPLSTVDIRTVTTGVVESTGTAKGETEQVSESQSGSRAVTSLMPQTRLAGDADYADTAVDTTGGTMGSGTGSETSESKSDQASESESQTKGFQGVASELLNAYRRSLMNIDLMVIEELNDLFMGVWDTGDTFQPLNLPELPSRL